MMTNKVIIILSRIQFSDHESIRLPNLIQPILESQKFKGIPKMIISQFCRGRFMNNQLATTDDFQPANEFMQSVNSQVSNSSRSKIY